MFKPVKDYEGLYEVSDSGIVKRLGGNVSIKTENKYYTHCDKYIRNKKEMILRPRIINKYLNVSLFKDGKYKHYRVHRLVAEAFCEKPGNAECVNHKNANKLDNRAENLEWVTQKENSQHAIKLGLWDKAINDKKIKVIMMSLDDKIITVKDSSREMAEFLKEKFRKETSIETMARGIRKACKCNEIGLENLPKKRGCRLIKPYGYKFMYLKDYSD